MNKASFIVVLVVFVEAVACCPCRKAGATAVVNDSTYISRIERERINIEWRLEYQPLPHTKQRDNFYIKPVSAEDLPKIEPRRSELRNDYSISIVEIDEDGNYTHTLETTDSAMVMTRYITEQRATIDSLLNRKRESKTIVKEVRKVTWWEKTQIYTLWLLLAILAIRYRKELIKIFLKIWI